MIDDLDGQQCADFLVSSVAVDRAVAARTLQAIAQWAVLHDATSVHQPRDASGHVLPGTERARQVGGGRHPVGGGVRGPRARGPARAAVPDVSQPARRRAGPGAPAPVVVGPARGDRARRCRRGGSGGRGRVAAGLAGTEGGPGVPQRRPVGGGGPVGGRADREGPRGAGLGPVRDQAGCPDRAGRPGARRGEGPDRRGHQTGQRVPDQRGRHEDPDRAAAGRADHLAQGPAAPDRHDPPGPGRRRHHRGARGRRRVRAGQPRPRPAAPAVGSHPPAAPTRSRPGRRGEPRRRRCRRHESRRRGGRGFRRRRRQRDWAGRRVRAGRRGRG